MRTETSGAEARRLIDALEGERQRQGMTKEQLSMAASNNMNTWGGTLKRGGTLLRTFCAVCEALDVEIVLVNREGVNIT